MSDAPETDGAAPFLVPFIDMALPPFLRTLYVDDQAQAVWSRRLWRIAHAWNQIGRASVGPHGVRSLATVRMPASDLEAVREELASDQLQARPLPPYRALVVTLTERSSTTPSPQRHQPIEVAIGTPAALAALEGALMANDSDQIGALLGYPACCRAFFAEVATHGFSDPIWPFAVRSQRQLPPAEASESGADAIALRGDVRMNILLVRLNVRTTPHIPCSLHCAPSRVVADQFTDLGQILGYQEELAWREELLSWPMAWSMLHGIAEIETPLFKIACNTDGTAGKHVVHWLGDRYPVTAATGLRFPYRRPAHLRVTGSKSYLQGLISPISLVRRPDESANKE